MAFILYFKSILNHFRWRMTEKRVISTILVCHISEWYLKMTSTVQVSISSTFYEQFFCGFCIFSGLKFMLAFFLTGKKAARKMLVKLITGEITNHSSNSSRSKIYHSICIDHLIVTGLTLAINLIVFSIQQIQ